MSPKRRARAPGQCHRDRGTIPLLHKILIDHLAEVIYAKGRSDVGRFKYEYNEFLKTLNGEKKIPEDWR
ncbi:unnamed protein product, partial [Mesorhabditis spiculigera]